MPIFRQCIILFVLGFVADLVQTKHIMACAERQKFMAVSTIIMIYLIGYWSHKWFNAAGSDSFRWFLTVAGALGAGLGTYTVLLFGE